MVLSEEAETALKEVPQSLIRGEMPPPLMVVAVVSLRQQDRDYCYKRSEYAARQIPEYYRFRQIA
ncbi:MAG: hypothetical protein AAGG02_03305 [Cyanobacteria bacterium P01_H01_bin.15]